MRVIIIGGGTAGISPATTAIKNRAETLLIEPTSTVGGDLFPEMPLLNAW